MTANIRDVAERAGVSVGTVSNVLNHREKVSPDAVRRVREAIEHLGYVRNDAARQLRVGRSSTVGLVVLDVRNPFFTDLARGAESEAARPPEDRPDAVFAANDLIAMGVLQGLARHGIRVPEEIAIIGFDDIDFASAAVVPLSSVRQPSQLMGETALRILLTEIGDPDRPAQQVVFEPELVVRASTSPAA